MSEPGVTLPEGIERALSVIVAIAFPSSEAQRVHFRVVDTLRREIAAAMEMREIETLEECGRFRVAAIKRSELFARARDIREGR